MNYHRKAPTCAAVILLGFIGNNTPLTAQQSLPLKDEPGELEETVVIANRVATTLKDTGSAVTVLEGRSLVEQQVYTLEDALGQAPGAFSESTGGQRGSVSSLFLRGTSTSHTHLQVDGVRLSDSTVSLNNFLGNASLGGVSTIGILRGPQSALYGGESIGGVVTIETARGEGPGTVQLFAEGGSFDSHQVGLSAYGEAGPLAYTLTLSDEGTANDAQGTPELGYRQQAYALRLDYSSTDAVSFGVTVRGGSGTYHDLFGGRNFTDYLLVTGVAAVQLGSHWNSRIRLGSYTEAYDFDKPSTFATDADKWSAGWENEVTWNAEHLTGFGALFEHTSYAQDFSFPGERDQLGFYANHVWRATDQLTISLGGRWEDYDDYGDEFTWRSTLAYTFPTTGTTLRASYGTAFRTPNLLELNGGPFEAGNPALGPERSRGWDLGVEQRLNREARIRLAWFENNVKHLIIDPFGSAPFNTHGSGHARGLEAALEGAFFEGAVEIRLAYTYLEESLNGLPDHVVDASATWHPNQKLTLGLGARYVGDRTLGGDPLDAYFLLRSFGSYDWNEHLQLTARLENALDQAYSLASFGGIPVAGRRLGAFAGLRLNW